MHGDSSQSLNATLSLIAMLVVAALAACGEVADPGPTTTSTTGASPGSEARLPEEFPEPGAVEEFDVLTLTTEDVHVQWEVGMSEDEAVDFFSDSLPEEGWEISSQRQGGDSTRFAISGHGWDGAVTVLGGDPVKVLLQLGVSQAG